MSLSPTSKVGYMDRDGMKRGSAMNLYRVVGVFGGIGRVKAQR